MEAIRGYLPKIRVPTFAQLKDGSFLSRAIEKYEEEAQHSIIRDLEVGCDVEDGGLSLVVLPAEQAGEGPGGRGLVQPHSEHHLGDPLPDVPLLPV